MNICLVNPTPKKIIEDHGTQMPHIGLGYLAGYLKENMKDVNLTVVDGKYENLNQADLLEKLKKISPDILGLTSFTQEIYDAAHIAGTMKSLKNTVTCVGGVHVAAMEEQVLEEFKEFDYAVVGEGEITFHELLLAIQEGNVPEDVKGVIYRRQDGSVVKNPPAELVMDIDSLPLPDWSFAPESKTYPIMSARGCPFRCVFCMRPYGDKPRIRSPRKVLDEIEHVASTYHCKNFAFRDESLGAVTANFTEILDGIVDRGLNEDIVYYGHTHVNLVSKELFVKMKQAGFQSVGIGVESGDEDVLRNIGKSITKERVVNAVSLAKQAGLRTSAFFILGLPNETYTSALRTIAFAKKLNTDTISIGIMIPFPKTKVFEMIQKGENGYITPEREFRWDEFNKQNDNPLKYKNVNYRALRAMQIAGYVYHTLGNFRIRSFMNRAIGKRDQILRIFMNLFRGKR